MLKYRSDSSTQAVIGEGFIQKHKTDYWHQFMHWFPEISERLWSNFRILSITIVVKRIEDNKSVTFTYKAPKGRLQV